ncbi:ASST-domain-containing protein [Neohortaea acidophila]|uniref:ASST-domain-containing protein n=1 Tax=Neohortaea acidophila TaxID=245834 RepID=A0A6A6Q5W1_9PEZI|nr:ASST-domain-containing protein [Neohortaea acidophila]KAF2487705.1 ASST-domain-containing protein [Neohortaea acidophila]
MILDDNGNLLDSSYSTIKVVGGREQATHVDLREFTIIPDGTVLTTAYVETKHGIEGPERATERPLWDCVLQEIDIDTGDILFQWSALDHVDLEDSYIDHKAKSLTPDLELPDWFYMNSIDKDLRGNNLICSGFTYSIYYIDGTNGDILWILGGKCNMFEDKSGGRALNFSGQHTAQWGEEPDTITLFNNDIAIKESQRRGMRSVIDPDAMTVNLLDEYPNPW